MRVIEAAIELRHRSMAEASDLGVALARSLWPSLWRIFLPVYAAAAVVSLSSAFLATWLPMLLIFFFKPWLDRTLLFVLSRAVFGQSTTRADLWRHRKAVWGSQWFTTFVLWRFSPWRSYVQPVVQLEGQRGRQRRERRRLLLSGWRFSAAGMQTAFATVEQALMLAILSAIILLMPHDTQRSVFDWYLYSESVWGDLLMAGAYMLVVFVLEPFYVAAGFAMYLNRRVQLEAWDVEQELRRVFPR
ncbi:Uncharacterised protein [Bordetella ansorpii]|uniref:DUF4129 domain-containing protein n=1 Tax=Bordetella ansorpii TaxID=288768 RepID=A0A157SNY9_9BORD|nr:hypothetical protein [Bordetella ansorpii]SAI72095.1 Uncharacterised protein [Bordetella ansorpii]